jgi:hypothetical protein
LSIVPTIPKVVYKTPYPEVRVSEGYTIFADELPEASDAARCWVVREIHGYWDETEPDPKQKFKNKAVSLSPTDPKHCVTIHEAHKIIDEQVLYRARTGFKYLLMLNMMGPPHDRFEIMPDGSYRELPQDAEEPAEPVERTPMPGGLPPYGRGQRPR